jgi:hypothetical protein
VTLLRRGSDLQISQDHHRQRGNLDGRLRHTVVMGAATHLPADRRAVLTRLRVPESIVAGQLAYRRRVTRASGRVMLSAHEAGWPIAWMAEELAIAPMAAQGRVQAARNLTLNLRSSWTSRG